MTQTAAQAYDTKLLADARALCNLSSTAEICEWFASRDRPLDDSLDAFPAAFGTLQAITQELIGMIGRADAERPIPEEWVHETAHGRGLASCGHPADEDGECSCSYWPERAPVYLESASDV